MINIYFKQMKNSKHKFRVLIILLMCTISASALPKGQRETLNPTNSSLNDVFTTNTQKTNLNSNRTDGSTNHQITSTSPERLQGSKEVPPKRIQGIVKDNKGEPLIGVSITIKGTTEGSLTDSDGKYEITLNTPSPILIFSYIGFHKQEIAITNQSVLDVTLQEDSQMMDEVVVTALGIKRAQKALSYNVQTVNSDELTTVKSTNIMNSLAGKVAGVNISAGSSGLGGATRVIMR